MKFDDFKKLVNENPERLEKVIKRNNEDSKAKIQRTVDHLDDYDSFALVTIRGGEAHVIKRGNPFELMAAGETIKNDAEKMMNNLPEEAQGTAAMMAFMNMLKGAKDDE